MVSLLEVFIPLPETSVWSTSHSVCLWMSLAATVATVAAFYFSGILLGGSLALLGGMSFFATYTCKKLYDEELHRSNWEIKPEVVVVEEPDQFYDAEEQQQIEALQQEIADLKRILYERTRDFVQIQMHVIFLFQALGLDDTPTFMQEQTDYQQFLTNLRAHLSRLIQAAKQIKSESVASRVTQKFKEVYIEVIDFLKGEDGPIIGVR